MLGAALVDIGGKFSFGGFRACRGSRIQRRRRGGNTENEVGCYQVPRRNKDYGRNKGFLFSAALGFGGFVRASF